MLVQVVKILLKLQPVDIIRSEISKKIFSTLYTKQNNFLRISFMKSKEVFDSEPKHLSENNTIKK